MSFSPSAIAEVLARHPSTGTCWVALSGGLDSVVLLHSLATLGLARPLKAVHVNHQLSPQADRWQAFCARLCESLGVAFEARRVAVVPAGRGLEDAARQARYQAFEACVEPGDLLCSAHHCDDQVETMLLRLMRGTGPRGLGGMAEARPLGEGLLVRPLLAFERASLEAYATEQDLSWVEDESNANTDFDRNFLRHQVLPQLALRWPGFGQRWQRTAELCRDADQLTETLAAEDLAAAGDREERLGQSLALAELQALTRPRRQQLLRLWLARQGAPLPALAQFEQIERQLIQPRSDSGATVRWGEISLRHFRGRLFLLPQLPDLAAPPTPIDWDGRLALALPSGGRLTAEVVRDGGLMADAPLLRPCESLHVRWREGGERCRPCGRAHSQTLKKLLSGYPLEPWLRPCVPLLYSAGALVAVGDLWVCEGFQAAAGEPGLRLHWQANASGA